MRSLTLLALIPAAMTRRESASADDDYWACAYCSTHLRARRPQDHGIDDPLTGQ